MKKITKFFAGIVFVANLAACAHQEPTRNQTYEKNYNQTSTPVVNTTSSPYQTACNRCQPVEYTVKTPVEIVYKNTTYRTVYVPQTSQSVSYEKRPYTAAESCPNSECPYQ